MEESSSNKGGSQGNVVRSSALRPLKATLSGRSTPTNVSPRSSPSLGRSNSGRTPRRESRRGALLFWCFGGSRLVVWLLLITFWTYGGFYIQSRWADSDKQVAFLNFSQERVKIAVSSQAMRSPDKLIKDHNGRKKNQVMDLKLMPESKDVALAGKESVRKGRGGNAVRRNKVLQESRYRGYGVQEPIPKTNATYGRLFGPFGSIEDRILEWSPRDRRGKCDRKEVFAGLVWSRKFVLIFHELSMTGAPLSMLELATELMSCGARVDVVVLNRRGGLMPELSRRRIKLVDDKAEHSFRAAMEADLVIAGSAVCASWIERYLVHYPAGTNQIIWWIMENRREYFERSKLVLHRAKTLLFLSESQSKQWLSWCKEENISLNTEISLIPLSVNDELAFAAGIPCSLNTPRFSPDQMLMKRQLLREAVRKEMGLNEDDMLVMALSSINAAKGQLLLVESASFIIPEQSQTNLERLKLRGLPQKLASYGNIRRLFGYQERSDQKLKILIGSVGSKSNKILYVKEIIKFLSENPNLSESVLWTPATTSVASLYSAADVYVTNSQGIGETFGRVTIEAMAFGLPVLGTYAGGTKEIVDQNETGLLHPVGRPGRKTLAENIKLLLENPTLRKRMGVKGTEKVEKFYLKRHMYKLLSDALSKSLQVT